MQIEDYETPDPYTPDPRASQRVAAQKRAQTQDDDAEPIEPLSRRRRYAVPFGVGAIVLIALMIGAASYQLAQLGSARPLAVTPGPSTQAFLGTPAQAFGSDPVASAVAAQDGSGATEAPEHTIAAYAAPDGLLLGPIEVDRTIVPVAHYGSGWIQADVDGSGRVWLRKGDVPNVAITGPDLAPMAAQPAQTGRGLPADTSEQSDWTPPEAAPEPVTGQKEAPDRAAHHAAAVARDHETHGQKGP